MKKQVAIVPTVLEQKLFGTPIAYVSNHIMLDAFNVGSFLGPLSQEYAYKPELRKRISELHAAACRSTNRFFVLNGLTCKTAQSTLSGALQYLGAYDVLVQCDF